MAIASTRPVNHAERDACIAAVAPFFAAATLDPVVRVTLDRVFHPAYRAYTDARATADAATGDATEASSALAAATDAFESAFLRWSRSVRDADGRVQVAALARLLGGVRPSDAIKHGPREVVTRVGRMLTRLDEVPELAGDPALLDAVRTSLAVLAPAVDAHEAAVRARIAANKALPSAATAFDRAWGSLVRAAASVEVDPLGAVIPTFHRAKPATAPAACAPAELPVRLTEAA
ncbi:MAG: hypothetical protein ABMB14_22305 [Myxococcota bacterium]